MSYDSEPKKHDANCDYDPLARRFICTCKKKWLGHDRVGVGLGTGKGQKYDSKTLEKMEG